MIPNKNTINNILLLQHTLIFVMHEVVLDKVKFVKCHYQIKLNAHRLQNTHLYTMEIDRIFF